MEKEKVFSANNVMRVFYLIGASIVTIGVIVMLVQNWEDIGFIGRVFSTLGIAIVFYIAGLLFRGPEKNTLSSCLFFVSSILMPLGYLVLLNEAKMESSINVYITGSAILSVLFLVAYLLSKRNILILVTTSFATSLYYLVLFKVFDYTSFDSDILKWATIVLGLSYIMIFKYVSNIQNGFNKNRVCSTLSNLGVLAILFSGLFIGGIFDVIYIAVLFGTFYFGVYLKDRSMFNSGVLFLVLYIIKLTSKYFSDSLGWSLSLIIIGLFIMGVGYLTFYLNRKFFPKIIINEVNKIN